ncbi:actin [Anaeramoeba ignava]|uniref:Actin n=1 Tax=Anaeramoeba ignava TaxID=1746090 RepID=A0A9Q0RJ62_ANAIG|nr:actin [Anaeramoeba ignava]
MFDEDEIQAIVLDNGSFEIRTGFAGDDAPRTVTSSVIGEKLNQYDNYSTSSKTEYIGNEAQKNREILNLNYPIQRGIVEDWDNMEKMWDNIFANQIKINPNQHPILMINPPFNPKSHREKTIQIMFETFDIPAFYIANSGVLSLYSSGRTTGIVVDIGHGVTLTQTIYEGYEIPKGIDRYDISGFDLTNFLIKLLEERGYSFTTSNEIEMAREIKEKLCYCSINYEEEIKQNQNQFNLEKEYELKNGDIISVSEERIKCCEGLFQPRLMGIDLEGIHKIIYNSIMESDIDARRDFIGNIVLSGGSTFFPKFSDRLENELKALFPQQTRVKLVAPPERKYSPWIGGSILASLSTFQRMWISKEEYDEVGPNIIDQKCYY